MLSADPSVYADADPERLYARQIRPKHMTRNLDTQELTLNVPVAFQFNPELSVVDVQMVLDSGSTIEAALGIPPNGAVLLRGKLAIDAGGLVKSTPNTADPIVGPAHCSFYCKPGQSTKGERANFRDALVNGMVWLAQPVV